MILANSGALRYDLYAGPFTRNDQFIVSPFTNTFEYLENVSSSVVNRVLDELNHSGLPARKRGIDDVEAFGLMNHGDPSAMYEQWMWEQWERWNMEQREATNLSLGYVTKDVSGFQILIQTPRFLCDSTRLLSVLGVSGCRRRCPTYAFATICYPAIHRFSSRTQ